MISDDKNMITKSSLAENLPPQEFQSKDKKDDATLKMIQKMEDIKIRDAIRRKFVFDDSWQRKLFPVKVTIQDKQLIHFYRTQTFDNQKNFAKDVFKAFQDLNTTHVLAVAPTQSGKTGSMLALAYEFTHPDAHNMRVDLDNVFVFTPHSSIEWTIQTKARFPESMKHNILHRNQAKHFVQRLRHLHNVLIIIDESHIANLFGQTLYNIYKQLNLFDIRNLYDKNIKIVHFTATPDNLLQNAHIWRNSLKVIHMKVPTQYVSVQHYYDNNQIFDAQPILGNIQHISQLIHHIDIQNPFFHIIRTPRGQKHFQLIDDFKFAFSSFDFQFISEPSVRNSFTFHNQVYDLLLHKPSVHTFIFIIDKLRCAKSIHIQHIQILYDRFVAKPSKDSILQGLLGRATGYHNHTSHIRIFTFKHILFQSQQLHKSFNIFNPS